MIVIYHCYGSAHSSVTAAAIHLDLLPRDRKPALDELLAVPRFDRTLTRELGTPFRMGIDRWSNTVYILGRATAGRMMGNLLDSLAQLYRLPPQEVLFVNALPQLSLTTTIGGTLSRGLGMVWPGRRMAAAGILMCYSKFVKMVSETEEMIGHILRAKEERPESPEN